MNGYTHKITRAVTVSAIDDATVSYMKFDKNITDLVTANTWTSNDSNSVNACCYNGNILANTSQTFDLTKDWEVSFDYVYISHADGGWNHIFSWRMHINKGGSDNPYMPIAFTNSRNSISNLWNWGSTNITNIWYNYKVKYVASEGKTYVYIDGTLKDTKTYTYTTIKGFYFSGGGNYYNVNCRLKNVVIKAYLSGATTQSTGSYPFTADTTGTGDIVLDYIGGNVITNDALYWYTGTNTRQSMALQLTGSQYLQKTDGFTLGGQDFTIEYWTYASTSVTRSTPFIFKVNQADGSTWRIYCYVHHSQGPFLPGVGLSSNTCTAGSGNQRGQLIHIAHVYNHTAKTYKTYINGVLKTTQNITIDSREWPYCYIGYQCNVGEPKYSGTIDEFRYSNIARYSGNFTPITTAYDLVGPSTIVTVPSGNVGYTGSPVQPAYDTDTTVVDLHNNIEVTGGNKTAVYKLKDTINMCWPDGTIIPKTVTYGITKTTAYYDQRCVTDLGNISANTVVDLSTLSTTGQDEFEYVDNTFRSGSSSYCVNNGQSHYWIKVTPTVNMTVNVTAQVGSENNYDFGLISVATSRSIPGRGATSITNGSIIMRGCNVVAKNTWSYDMTAGTTYWVGFHYAKDVSVNNNGDRLWIHGVNFTVTGSAMSDSTGNIWNLENGAAVSATNAKFGNALQLTGSSNAYIELSGGITLGGSDFTIDWWGVMNSTTGNYGRMVNIFNAMNSNTDGIYFCKQSTTSAAHVRWTASVSVTNIAYTFGTLHHHALVYVHAENKGYLFIDGVLTNTTTVTIPAVLRKYCWLGSNNMTSEGKFDGTIDEFRISNVARWTADFTPPTAAYGYDTNTVALLHF